MYSVPVMRRHSVKLLLLGLGGLVFTWFFWLSGNPLLGNGCSRIFAASDLFRPAGNYHIKSLFAPGLLFYFVQGILAGLLTSMVAIRVMLTLYVFSLVFGSWFALKAYNRPEIAILMVFPLIFNAAICRGDLPLVVATGLFPWLIWGFRTFMQKPDRRHGFLLLLLNLSMFYADFMVFCGVLVLQVTLVAQNKNRKQTIKWVVIILLSIVPALILAGQGGMAPWWQAFRHSPRGFLHYWYLMSGDCFRGYWYEWSFVAGGFAILVAVVGQKKVNKMAGSMVVLLAFVLLVPSGVSKGLTMGARMVIPTFLFLGLFAAQKDMRWPRMFTALAAIAAVLSMIGANRGMINRLAETHAYNAMQGAVHTNSSINEICFGKNSKSVIYPGWSNWNKCIAANKSSIPALVSRPSRFEPLSTISYFDAHATYTMVCKRKKHIQYCPPDNTVQKIKSGDWTLFMRRNPAAPSRPKNILPFIRKFRIPNVLRLRIKTFLPGLHLNKSIKKLNYRGIK